MIINNFLNLSLFWILQDEKVCSVFSITSFGTKKYDYVMNIKEIFNFLISSSMTTGWSFLLLIISAIISSNTINTFRSFPELYSSVLLLTSFTSFEYFIKVFAFLRCFRPTSSLFFMRYQYFNSDGSLT